MKNHGVTFPLMKKSEVNGDGANEVCGAYIFMLFSDGQIQVYKYLKSQKSGLLGMSRIKWNFEKVSHFFFNK